MIVMSDVGVNFCTVRIDDNKCSRCLECVDNCPTGALTYEAPVTFTHNAYECSYCECCMDLCSDGALQILEM